MSKVIGEPLTSREEEIRALAARGLSNAEIASVAHISEATVKTHLRSIFAKTGFTSRAQIAAARPGDELVYSGDVPPAAPTRNRSRRVVGPTLAAMGVILVILAAVFVPRLFAAPPADRSEWVTFTMPTGTLVDCEFRFRIMEMEGSTVSNTRVDEARAALTSLSIETLAREVNDGQLEQDPNRYAATLAQRVEDRLGDGGLLGEGIGLETASKCHI